MSSVNFSWLGGMVGGAMRPGRETNAGGSAFGGTRTLGKDMLEGAGSAVDEQFASEAKKAKSLRTLFKLYGAEMGQPQLADHAETLSLGELEGGLKAYVLQQDADERKQKLEYQSALMQQLKDVREERARDSAATQEFGRLMAPPVTDGGQMVGQFLDPSAPVNMNVRQAEPLAAFAQAAAKTRGTPDVGRIGSVMSQFGPAAAGQPAEQIEEFTTAQGTPGVRLGRTFMFDPAATAKIGADARLNEYERKLEAQRAALEAAGIPPVPTTPPPEGYDWAWNGKAWVHKQKTMATVTSGLMSGSKASAAPAKADDKDPLGLRKK